MDYSTLNSNHQLDEQNCYKSQINIWNDDTPESVLHKEQFVSELTRLSEILNGIEIQGKKP